jgi:uncharacterized membrane protein YeaQ/YmgE (transglycosylase-associated protein family)
MEWLWTIIVAVVGGAIIGALARLILPGRQNIPIWLTVLIGIAAALLGGAIATWLGVGETRGIDWWRHIIQVAVAVLFVWIAARMWGNRTAGHGTGTGRPVA